MTSAPPPISSDASASKRTFIIGTRQSKLALLQTNLVLAALKEANPDCSFDIHSRETAGDKNTNIAFREFTTKNLWTEELEELLIAGHVDFIVHSLKDVPTLIPSSCTLGPMMKREDSRDVLVVKQGLPHKSLADLPAGAVVGTSSVRRSAQLAQKYPHLKVVDVRGNIGTRLAKLDAEDSPFSCIILAAAGLHRLGLEDRISQYLDSKNGSMLHAVGQGALGIEIRKNDKQIHDMLSNIGDKETTLAALAERSLLRTLEGGCSAPLGAETEWVQAADGSSKLRMRSIVVSVDGSRSAEVEVDGVVDSAEAAEEFGVTVAKALVKKGAGSILEEIQQNKVTS
ncbi:porphobilinogen deaminase [Aspergillus chevalieri]|uniref:Porphobilinogen deaminase n=1 Tax=Aspergillus chevalieri TaxID=182096 RepID=A0A7R7VPW8_ASPCH|nr:porphobilinogen deaminase [Aspergillus chevalieri]BCR88630.1 porphobilinogen deaminase [Aspergillus chevalieri]